MSTFGLGAEYIQNSQVDSSGYVRISTLHWHCLGYY